MQKLQTEDKVYLIMETAWNEAKFIALGSCILLAAIMVAMSWFQCDLSMITVRLLGKPVTVLRDKVIWVTGASGGIGEQLAYELARGKCHIVLSARRVEELDRVARNITSLWKSPKCDVMVLPLDVTDHSQHQRGVDAVMKKFGRVDVFVNNAGKGSVALQTSADIEVDRALFDINVFGPLALTRIIAKVMINQGQGHIAAVGSMLGKWPSMYSGSYSASKAALLSYMETLRVELAGVVTVSVICPGPVDNSFSANSFTSNTRDSFKGRYITSSLALSVDNCAYYTAMAIANEVEETWLAKPPLLFFYYVAHFFPSLCQRHLLQLLRKMSEYNGATNHVQSLNNNNTMK